MSHGEEHLRASHRVYKPDTDQPTASTMTEKDDLSLETKAEFDMALVQWILDRHDRNRLRNNMIEASERLNAWYKQGIIC